MIITGICFLMLGAGLGQAAIKTDVKYLGLDKITVNEHNDGHFVFPEMRTPKFAPSFYHQGSNFFFNPQVAMSQPAMIPAIESLVEPTPINEVLLNPIRTEQIIEEVKLVPELPKIEIDPIPTIVEPCAEIEIKKVVPEIVETIIDPLPMKEVILIPEAITEKIIEKVEIIEELPKIEFKPLPIEIKPLPIEIPLVNPPVLVEPCLDIDIKNTVSTIPIFIEEPIKPGKSEVFVTKIDHEIAAPPMLPPLILHSLPKPLIVEESKKVLEPKVVEMPMFYPPSLMAERPLFPVDCAQNIVYERVLPNLAFEYGKKMELVSIPASKKAPLMSTFLY